MSEETVPAVGYRDNLPISDSNSLIDASIPRPVPGDRDLLVEVRAVSVNPVDVKTRANSKPDGLRVLGYDAAGVVVEVGSGVELFEVGDEVWYAGSINRQGSNARLQAVDERIVAKKPTSLSFADAAALPLTALTAWEALFDKLDLTPASAGTLLVVGGSGGVGSIMIQLVRELLPEVRVIATASTPDAERFVRDFGAHEVVRQGDGLAKDVLRLVPGGVEWIFTTASIRDVNPYVEMAKPFGAIASINDVKDFDLMALKAKALSWHWELMFARSTFQTDDMVEQHRILEQVARLVDAGAIRSTVTRVLSPIDAEQLREAHRIVESHEALGKVVVAN